MEGHRGDGGDGLPLPTLPACGSGCCCDQARHLMDFPSLEAVHEVRDGGSVYGQWKFRPLGMIWVTEAMRA